MNARINIRNTTLALLAWCCVFIAPAGAMLNENCVVSVLNRSVPAGADGSWVLPNVPANFGQVRARATCSENGMTSFGESGLFSLGANQTINLPNIELGNTTPIPVSIALQAPSTTLTQVGATVQLTVTATYAGGQTQNVTAGSTGTEYNVSNSAVALVSVNGLVTAVASGTVLLSAVHDGVLGLLRVQVVLGGDQDGDGIPDDLEIANGLSPTDPVDAEEDIDRDGLTNKQELIDFGTDLDDADSDNDGINDGEEVMGGNDGFVTDPLLADSDGDGVRDGLEIQSGSDPTNPNSINLAQALQSIDLQPSVFTLTVNTIIGEASRQFSVIGRLLDGTDIDLTSTTRGTNYESSDLNVCNFGAPDGRVFAGNDGVCAITVSNSGFVAVANGGVQTFAPVARGVVSIPGYANNVDVSGDYAFVAAGAAGLQVVDVSNPTSPQVVAGEDTPGNANDVRIVGTLAFVADGSSGLQIIDVADPLNPAIIGSADTTGDAQDVVVQGTYAYVADGSSGLQVIDVQTPSAPAVVGTADTPGTARGVGVTGTLVALVDDDPSTALRIVNVSDPEQPTIIGAVGLPGEGKDVSIRGSVAFVAAYTGGLQVVDFSTPNTPAIVGSLPDSFVPRDVEVLGTFALFAEQLFPNAVPIVEISAPSAPSFRDTLDLSPLGDYAGTGIALTAQHVYVTGEFFFASNDNGVSGDTRLFIGQYLNIDDTAGIAPTVTITSPANGNSVFEGASVTVSVDANDDFAVTAVSFFVDGQLVGSDTTAPYQFNVTVPTGVTSVTIGATAIDGGSNIGTATDIVLNVNPDPAPMVSITSPADGAILLEGEGVDLVADASDNEAVTSVRFRINGVDVGEVFDAPYIIGLTVPTGLTSITIEAIATDNLGRTSSAMRTVSIIPDPLTTVTGQIEDSDGNAIAGATVTCLGVATTTAADGSFSVAGVSTVQGDVRCVVRFVTQGGTVLTAIARVAPVRGGTTAFGVIVLSEGLTFSVGVGSTGVAGSGIEQAAQTSEEATSVYRASGTGSNQLVQNGLDIGVEPLDLFGERSNVDAIDLLEDGSLVFSVDYVAAGVPGSAVEQASDSGLLESNIYRSVGDGTNTLYASGADLGIESYTDTNLDALALLPDGSVLFSVSEFGQGVTGSALAASDPEAAGRNIYRSFRDGTNVLFRSAADLGVTAGDVRSLSWNGDGSLLFTVRSDEPPVGEPAGNAAGEAPPTPTPVPTDTQLLVSDGDGDNSLYLLGSDLGVEEGEVDALAVGPVPTTDAGGVPPSVSITAPAAGQDLIEDDTVIVRVQTSDDVAVASVEVSLGASVVTVTFPGKSTTVTLRVPLGVGPLTLSALATDLGGNIAMADVPVDVIPDPGTTVVGLVVDELGDGVVGATVTVTDTLSGTTDADGAFSIANAPTIRGPLVVRASATVSGQLLKGKSAATPPVAGDVTDVGTIVVAAGAVVGYYDMDFSSGNPEQVAAIQTNTDFTPVNITGLTGANLQDIDILLVQNPDNGGYGADYLNNLQKVSDFVAAGGVLVLHDRHVETAESILPGEPGNIFRNFDDDANIEIIDNTTSVTNGPGGLVTATNLDFGNSSSHGFAVDTPDSELHGILSRGNPVELVTYWYAFGSGKVIYSTIPLDYYLGGAFPQGLGSIYAPNVIAFANDLRLQP